MKTIDEIKEQIVILQSEIGGEFLSPYPCEQQVKTHYRFIDSRRDQIKALKWIIKED